MEKHIDLRKLGRDEILELRKQVVDLKSKGRSGAEIEAALHIRQNRISEIWALFLKEGAAGLAPSVPGRKPGEKTLLSGATERNVRRVMVENTPDDVGMPYSLWTRNIASDFIRREYGVRLSLRSMTNYFKRWGFAGGGSAEYKRFMDKTLPAIVRRASKENVGIYWYSEAVVSGAYPQEGGGGIEACLQAGEGAGEACPQEGGGGPERVTMAAAVTGRGTARFMFFEGGMTQDKFIHFIGRLIRYADRKVFLIASGRAPCSGEKVEEWLKGREDHLEVFYYSVR